MIASYNSSRAAVLVGRGEATGADLRAVWERAELTLRGLAGLVRAIVESSC